MLTACTGLQLAASERSLCTVELLLLLALHGCPGFYPGPAGNPRCQGGRQRAKITGGLSYATRRSAVGETAVAGATRLFLVLLPAGVADSLGSVMGLGGRLPSSRYLVPLADAALLVVRRVPQAFP